MKKGIVTVLKRIKEYIRIRYEGTDRAVYILLLATAFLLGSLSFLEIGIPKWLAFPLFGSLAMAAVALFVWLGSWLLHVCLYRGERHLIVLGILFGCILYFCMSARMKIVPKVQGVLAAVFVFIICDLFVRSLYAMVYCKKRNRSVFVLCVGSGLLFAAFLIFMRSEGFEDAYIDKYIGLGRAESGETLMESDLAQGDYEVAVIEYGAELKRVKPPGSGKIKALESSAIDLSPYVGGYRGIDAAYRRLYLGYDIRHVPLAGRIWYPKEGENCPVLFIIHGNHNFTTQSYLGYDYLASYLASHGYVVVSVDENACNSDMFKSLSEENDARAVLLLENIGKVLSYNRQIHNPLCGRINEEQIAIAGHSRGGEAAAIAAYFNTLSNYPENGRILFDYHYPVRSVIAIAPSVDQYQPADRSVELYDVNYLLLQGANDQDISVFMGLKQYNNIHFTGDGEYFKSYLYIAKANHGQFNTKWGKYDMPYPFSELLNVENLLPRGQQQMLLKLFAKRFLDVTLKGDARGKNLFYHVQGYQKDLPKTVYIQGYSDSSADVICDFEEDLDLTTGTMEGSTVGAQHMSEWTEKLSRFSTGNYRFDKDDYSMSLRWHGTCFASAFIRLPSYDAAGRTLSFDIMDMDNADVREENYHALECTVVLTDAEGRKAKAAMRDYCTIYPPLPVRLSKLQFIFGKNEYKHQFQTVRIPVSEFAGHEDFDASNIAEIRFCFDQDENGSIRLDDIAFTME